MRERGQPRKEFASNGCRHCYLVLMKRSLWNGLGFFWAAVIVMATSDPWTNFEMALYIGRELMGYPILTPG